MVTPVTVVTVVMGLIEEKTMMKTRSASKDAEARAKTERLKTNYNPARTIGYRPNGTALKHNCFLPSPHFGTYAEFCSSFPYNLTLPRNQRQIYMGEKWTFCYGGVTYSCVDQYMCAQKLSFFGMGTAPFAEIMACKKPSTMISKTNGYMKFLSPADICQWMVVMPRIMYCGMLAKFIQNKDLSDILVGTKDFTLVCDSDDPLLGVSRGGGGDNMEGNLLANVRDYLQSSIQIDNSIDMTTVFIK